MCLAATVDVPTPALLRKAQAMRYHLEGWIPWSAEDYVSDYVAHTSTALMAAVQIGPLKGFIAQLEDLDVSVAAITPMAFLALDEHLQSQPPQPDHVLLWRHSVGAEMFVIRDAKPLVWRSLMPGAEEYLQALAMAALELPSGTPFLARGLDEMTRQGIESVGLTVETLDGPVWEAAALRSENRLVAGDQEPLINFRRDELAGAKSFQSFGRQLARLKFAAATALLCFCGALWQLGDRYRESAAFAESEAATIFEKTFPKAPVPENVLAALRRAHQVLQGTRGPVKEIPSGPSADLVLEKILATLPTDLRYRVPELRIEGANIYLNGEVRSNADADRIVSVLREQGLQVEPPHTQRLPEQGFSVRVAASSETPATGKTVK
jgi:hypothetical protein